MKVLKVQGVILFVLIFSTHGSVEPNKLENSESRHRNERSLALAFVPNQVTDMTAGQIIASAFEKQLSPKGITGQIVVNVMILIFETVGYTIGSTIYTILNTFGIKQDFFTQVFGPFGSLFIQLRWIKNLFLATSTFILLNYVFAPTETLDVLDEQGVNKFKDIILKETFPVALIREFIVDSTFGIRGFTILWLFIRYMNNVSMNPGILFLRVWGVLPPPGNARSAEVPDSEESIEQGYHDMLRNIKSEL